MTPNDDIRPYRLMGRFTILQTMFALALLGVVLTLISHYYFG